jgi:hypothetical protein
VRRDPNQQSAPPPLFRVFEQRHANFFGVRIGEIRKRSRGRRVCEFFLGQVVEEFLTERHDGRVAGCLRQLPFDRPQRFDLTAGQWQLHIPDSTLQFRMRLQRQLPRVEQNRIAESIARRPCRWIEQISKPFNCRVEALGMRIRDGLVIIRVRLELRPLAFDECQEFIRFFELMRGWRAA